MPGGIEHVCGKVNDGTKGHCSDWNKKISRPAKRRPVKTFLFLSTDIYGAMHKADLLKSIFFQKSINDYYQFNYLVIRFA